MKGEYCLQTKFTSFLMYFWHLEMALTPPPHFFFSCPQLMHRVPMLWRHWAVQVFFKVQSELL